MTGNDLLTKLLAFYKESYDIKRACDVNGDVYDAYARFHITGSKYVLVKKAELWRAECFEHIFFRVKSDVLTAEEIERFRTQVVEYIEPQIVREGKKWPEKDHMYTYMTAIYLCENGVEKEAEKRIRRFRYVKNYMMTIRGYSDVKILVFDLKNKKIFGNRSAKELVKGYKKAGFI